MPHRVLAILAWRDGDRAVATDHAAQAAILIRDQGDRYVQATSMRQLAVIIGSVDRAVAAELLGIAEALVPEVRVSARDAAAGRACAPSSSNRSGPTVSPSSSSAVGAKTPSRST